MIPQASIERDRLAIVGTSGSGKSYLAMLIAETLMGLGRRVIIIDPLGAWFGLRLLPDGSPSPFKPVIFGGAHGDIAIGETAGKIIGETVATSADSCIIDMSRFPTAASERRFMLAFLTALYSKTVGTPVHLFFDEADMFAPQFINDRDGDAAKLLGMVETVVRRGRIKGFIPTLITQRPAVLNKNVMSQADGLIAMKLTSSQDRKAIGAWVEGQADKGQWKAISAELPTLKRGSGVVWMPGRSILETMSFGKKLTFDSSRTPEHGETFDAVKLVAIDIGALRDRLASVEQETKANDPRVLKAEIARLKSEMQKQSVIPTNSFAQSDIDAAERRGKEIALNSFSKFVQEAVGSLEQVEERLQSTRRALDSLALFSSSLAGDIAKPPKLPNPVVAEPPTGNTVDGRGIAPNKVAPPSTGIDSPLKASLQRVVDAIAWWHKIGLDQVPRSKACIVAGLSPKASTFGVYVAELIRLGFVEAKSGALALTDRGLAIAVVPFATTADGLKDVAESLLTSQQKTVFGIVYSAYPDSILRREVAERMGLSPSASTSGVYIASVASFGLVYSSGPGVIRAADWLFP